METQISHSLWRITTREVAGKKFYQVYRLIDKNRVDVEGNRETRGGYYEHYRDAEALARLLNTEGAVL